MDPRADSVAPKTEAPPRDVASLDGIVSDENFIPVQGAHVRLVEMGLEARTSWNGKFSFSQVPPDVYTLSVTAIGWRDFEERLELRAGRGYTMTVFLDRSVGKIPEPEVRLVRGVFTCGYVEAAGQNTNAACDHGSVAAGFPKDWAAIVTEATWQDGASTSTYGLLSAQYRDASGVNKPYGRVTAEPPARMELSPGQLHQAYHAEAATPAKGVSGPLDVDLRKASAMIAGIGASVTVQQAYEIYVSTFYYEAPTDLTGYSALPR